MNDYFKHRVVWVTGASSGIGEALAYAFASKGAYLILSARNEDALIRVRDKCACPPEHVKIVPLDLSQPETLNEKAVLALTFWGYIDYMVHNAGIAARDLAEDTSMEVIRKVMETNFFGTIALTKALLPNMLQKKHGHFVVILSLSAKFGAPQLSAYAASKHALVGYFESLRTEVENSGIGIHMMIPGFINTPILKHAMDGSGVITGRNLAVNEKGMSPKICAEHIVRAVRKGKKEAAIGGEAHFSIRMYRYFPNMFRSMIKNHPLRRLHKALPWLFK